MKLVVITTAQLHFSKPKLRFCAGSNPAWSLLEICDSPIIKDYFWLEISLLANNSVKTIQHHHNQ